jgi:Ca-activated chloride channel homolog
MNLPLRSEYNCLSMRISRLLWAAPLAATFALRASAQDTSNLPSAPSTTLEQQQRQAVPPAPKPEQPKTQEQPKTDNANARSPVIESLDPPKPRPEPQPAANESQSQVTAQPGSQHLESEAKTQAPAGKSEQDAQSIIRTTVNEVNVVFTVTDKHNRYVKGLQEADFKVFDDRKPAASVRNFSAETNLPLRVGLLIDASNSIRDRFRFEQQAAIEFLNQIIRPDRDQAFVLGFDTTPEITQDFTGNPEKLANGVRMLRPGGGTAMYDAIYGSCRDKLSKTQSKQGGLRRAIILVSDGEDNQSRVTRDDAIEEAQRAEVIVYAISTNVSGTKTRGDKILEAIAEATGGRAFFPFKIEEVSDAFSQIQEELRSQYAISYKPADFLPDGKYRSIDIEAVNKKYKVRSRKGYFAPRAETASTAAGH